MSQPFFYCSELSRSHAEKPLGTASTGVLWLLVEYPHAWGRNALHDSDLSTQVKAYLNNIVKTVPRSRVLFIKQGRTAKRDLNFFVVRAREREPFIVRFKLSSHERLTSIDVAEVAAKKSLAGGVIEDNPLFLVCTHGRRDKCCAKFGYPLYKALREQASDSLWQSSHVGGDRFAANLICFPHGLFYAHVTEDTGREIICRYKERRLALGNYRGRACYSSPVQAAEFFIRRTSGLSDLDGLRHLSRERVDASTWRVRFISAGQIHEAVIKSSPSAFQTYATCQATEERQVTQYLLDDYRIHMDAQPALV